MTEKEKAAAGYLYNANYDEEILNEISRCNDLCHEFNQIKPSDREAQGEILKQILGTMGEQVTVNTPFWCDYGYNIEIGENFYSNHNLIILDCNKVKFGNNVFIGPNCSFYCAEHPLDITQRNRGLEYAKPITVGDNVWFGGSVTVLSGVTIGNGAVIGAGSIVTKDVPDNVVVAGNPAKIIKVIK